jgi:plasmid rolling circle replication initiator protein Rep
VYFIKDKKIMQTYEVKKLKDEYITKSGKTKERPWRYNKRYSNLLSQSLQRIEQPTKSNRVKYCGCELEFRKYEDGTKKLDKAEFCKYRLCPMCAWRRSIKVFAQLSKVMDYLEKNHEYEYIFLTLTVENPIANDLSKTIDEIAAGFKALTKTKEFKKLSQGYFKALEVTKEATRTAMLYDENGKFVDNDDAGRYYHPHLHVIIAVNKSYFQQGGNSGYLSHKKWMKLWRKCMNIEYDPWVYIKKVREKTEEGKSTEGEISYSGAVAEVAKYSVKMADSIIIDPYQVAKNSGMRTSGERYENMKNNLVEPITDERVFIVDGALKNRRMISFGGKMREVHKLLNLDDPTDGDLVHTGEDEKLREDLDKFVMEIYRWNVYEQDFVMLESGQAQDEKTNDIVSAGSAADEEMGVGGSPSTRKPTPPRNIWNEKKRTVP